MILMRGKDITQAIGKVESRAFFGPKTGETLNPSNGPSNVFAPHQDHKRQAPYQKTGSLVFLCK